MRVRVDPRQRAGIAIVALVYTVGFVLGRASGRMDSARELIAHAARPRSS